MHRVVIDYVLVVNSLLFVLDSLIVSSDINQSHRKGVIRVNNIIILFFVDIPFLPSGPRNIQTTTQVSLNIGRKPYARYLVCGSRTVVFGEMNGAKVQDKMRE